MVGYVESKAFAGPPAFATELNIVRSIRTILYALDPTPPRRRSHSSIMDLAGPSSPPQPATNTYNYDNNYASASGYTSDEYAGGADSDPESDPGPSSQSRFNFQAEPDPAPEWEALRARLLPLRHLEALLITRLVPLHEDEPTRLDFGGGLPPGTEVMKEKEGAVGGGTGVFSEQPRARHGAELSADRWCTPSFSLSCLVFHPSCPMVSFPIVPRSSLLSRQERCPLHAAQDGGRVEYMFEMEVHPFVSLFSFVVTLSLGAMEGDDPKRSKLLGVELVRVEGVEKEEEEWKSRSYS
ncbi:hypothetical protein B0H14DRAFT_3895152 [Mycena olivaceomarginata]|nr:hypothetical protein B0H14DRAFT_3895152 [Mycena olivaceomarginata]